jgi:general secretion pathway protein G
MLRSKTNNSGFSLIEIMVVMIIIGILAALVAPRLIQRADEARVTEARIQIKNFETALKMYKMDNGIYPSTDQGLSALVHPPLSGEIPENFREGGYLEKKSLPADPWNNPYVYISPGESSDYDIISQGADGKPGGDKYDADISNLDID